VLCKLISERTLYRSITGEEYTLELLQLQTSLGLSSTSVLTD